MSAAWIIVLLFAGAFTARLLRSTKMWWVFLFTMMAGLLVGMLSKEAIRSLTKDNRITSITQLVNTGDITSAECTLPVALVTETTSQSGVTSYIPYSGVLSDALTSIHTTNGRDSPAFEDDS